jgi:hypothetical protein
MQWSGSKLKVHYALNTVLPFASHATKCGNVDCTATLKHFEIQRNEMK